MHRLAMSSRERVRQMFGWAVLLLAALLGIGNSLEKTMTIQAGRQLTLRVMDPSPEFEEGEADTPQALQLIFPGTKWCGDGNKSMHDEDYGFFMETDKCCKDHDYCPDYIAGGETKYELQNDAFYTRLHCDCDVKFYDCLKASKSFVSDEIGFTYFNAIGTRCYRKDYPIVRCFKYSTIVKRRCRVYELDQTQPPIWQWFDLPIY